MSLVGPRASGVDQAGESNGLVVYTTNIDGFQTAAEVATALNNLVGLGASDERLFAVGDGNSTRLWSWEDTSADGAVDAVELDTVADLTSVNEDDLTADNFADFS